ncbi:MAG TPA: hypothetical protein DEA51_06515 [Erysipelotrichaceae bacterium]|nr:hypothetical protein [Erysipelotrichaceae bacterium]
MKKVLILMLSIFLMGFTPSSNQDDQLTKQGELAMKETNIVTFDLNLLESSESITVYPKSGKKAIITLSSDELEYSFDYQSMLANKTYTISYSSLTENISYKINVYNNSMTSVHSGTHTVFGYTVNSSVLRLNSSKSSSYILHCSFLFRSWTNSLNAKITSTNMLEVTFNG